MKRDSTKCPRCGEDSPLTDWCEIDIGVGVHTWGEQYTCPTHGTFEFGFGIDNNVTVFQQDGPEHVAGPDEIEFIEKFGPKK